MEVLPSEDVLVGVMRDLRLLFLLFQGCRVDVSIYFILWDSIFSVGEKAHILIEAFFIAHVEKDF